MDEICKRNKDFAISVKDISAQEPRTLMMIGSTEESDRDGDVILSGGWDLKNYMKNPVVLWAHDYSRPPVGITKAVYVDQRTKQLCFKIYFPSVDELGTKGQPASDHALFVDTIYSMYKSGLLNASSVGFVGKKMEPRKDQEEKPVYARGLVFAEQELIELSCVPVPANASALVSARGMKGFDERGIDMVEKAINEAHKDVEEASKGEDMADKFTEEEVTKIKEFIAGLSASPEKASAKASEKAPEQKANRKLSADSLARVTKAIEHATNCMGELKGLVSDGTEEQTSEASDGVEENAPPKKSLDLSTLTVEQANEYLRLGGNHKGA